MYAKHMRNLRILIQKLVVLMWRSQKNAVKVFRNFDEDLCLRIELRENFVVQNIVHFVISFIRRENDILNEVLIIYFS